MSLECLDGGRRVGVLRCLVPEEDLCWAHGREAVSWTAVITAQVQGEKKHAEGCGDVGGHNPQPPPGTPPQPFMPSLPLARGR